ncbi:hypothetical protein QWY82_10500 [Simiduia curdlanivorans]|uniref:Uncharacterized protein n=1 Tax=Simiduia curdlanivorans TaxID=1492769 RepID=A0ABV8UZ69_9GAMM|nr:hypothetical protein [Simiduia curdlanivorans]MDN3639240.1 hypothetical protein [Simiduia curdlanivorans]
MNYIPPKAIKNWKNDNPDGELYEASIMDNNTVISAYGRYSHGSSCKIVSWKEFLGGEMNELVSKTMGSKVLNEILHELQSIT